MMQTHRRNMQQLKQVQKEQSEILMHERSQTLENVLRKNQKLVDSVPEVIAVDSVRKEFLKQREHLMVRLIQQELRNKKMGEWTMRSLAKIQRDQQIGRTQRPPSVIKYLQ